MIPLQYESIQSSRAVAVLNKATSRTNDSNTEVMVARVGEKEREEKEVLRPRIRYQVEVAESPLFNREAGQVTGFVIACRLYI